MTKSFRIEDARGRCIGKRIVDYKTGRVGVYASWVEPFATFIPPRERRKAHRLNRRRAAAPPMELTPDQLAQWGAR